MATNTTKPPSQTDLSALPTLHSILTNIITLTLDSKTFLNGPNEGFVVFAELRLLVEIVNEEGFVEGGGRGGL